MVHGRTMISLFSLLTVLKIGNFMREARPTVSMNLKKADFVRNSGYLAADTCHEPQAVVYEAFGLFGSGSCPLVNSYRVGSRSLAILVLILLALLLGLLSSRAVQSRKLFVPQDGEERRWLHHGDLLATVLNRNT